MAFDFDEIERNDKVLAMALGAVAAGAFLLLAMVAIERFVAGEPSSQAQTSGANTLYPTQ